MTNHESATTEDARQAADRRRQQARQLVQAATRYSTWPVGAESYLDANHQIVTGFSYVSDRELLASAMARLVMAGEGAGA